MPVQWSIYRLKLSSLGQPRALTILGKPHSPQTVCQRKRFKSYLFRIELLSGCRKRSQDRDYLSFIGPKQFAKESPSASLGYSQLIADPRVR